MTEEKMNNVNKTLYIPLYGKAYVSKKGLFLSDERAELIWEQEKFPLKGKSKSKWLAYYMGIRSAVFDRWTRQKILSMGEDVAVIHIGCGMDSRVLRVGCENVEWWDVDMPEVIRERMRYYNESNLYKMIGGDVRRSDWMERIPKRKNAVVVIEGVSMYLTQSELEGLFSALGDHFENVSVLMDCYTDFAAKMSKYKNPVNDVGVSSVYGIDDPTLFEKSGLSYVREHEMTPKKYVDELKGREKVIFSKLYAGRFSKKLYRLFEYEKKSSTDE